MTSRRTPTPFAALGALTATLLLLALTALAGLPGGHSPGAQNCARASLSAAPTRAQATPSQSACTHPGSSFARPEFAAGCCVAAKAGTGGINAVRLGQAGEDAVRGAYNIGDKVPISVAGRGRIPDGLTTSTLSEVKNTASLSYTRQLRDFAQYAQQTGRSFDLYVRPTTRLSGPLQRQVASGSINLRFIP